MYNMLNTSDLLDTNSIELFKKKTTCVFQESFISYK